MNSSSGHHQSRSAVFVSRQDCYLPLQHTEPVSVSVSCDFSDTSVKSAGETKSASESLRRHSFSISRHDSDVSLSSDDEFFTSNDKRHGRVKGDPTLLLILDQLREIRSEQTSLWTRGEILE